MRIQQDIIWQLMRNALCSFLILTSGGQVLGAEARLDAGGLPTMEKGATFTRGDVSIVCDWNLPATSWGRPIPGRRDQEFLIFQDQGSGNLVKVGNVLTQCMTQDDIYGQHCRIREIAVEEYFHRRGIATAAMTLIEAMFPGFPLKLEVNIGNKAARGLFAKTGFSFLHSHDWGDVEIWVKNYDRKAYIGDANLPRTELLTIDELMEQNPGCAQQ